MSLSVPTLAVVDNVATPTGLVATVTGSDPASVNRLSWQRVDAGFSGRGWNAGPNRTGDGTIAAAVPQGIYWLKVDSVLSAQSAGSNLAYLAVSDGQLAIHEQCIRAVEAGLVSLVAAGRLPGITLAERITDHAELNLKAIDLPGIACAICLPGQQPGESVMGGTNARDDIGFPVFAVLLDRASGDYVVPRPGYLKIRESIFRYFREQRLAGLQTTECLTTKVEPGPVLKYESFQGYQLMGSVLTIRARIRDIRG